MTGFGVWTREGESEAVLCPHCGSPDVRQVVRQRGPLYYVDLRCIDCGAVVFEDAEGGL